MRVPNLGWATDLYADTVPDAGDLTGTPPLGCDRWVGLPPVLPREMPNVWMRGIPAAAMTPSRRFLMSRSV
jgi:hypothetical protein